MFVNALMLPQFDYLDIMRCREGKIKLSAIDVFCKKVAKIATLMFVNLPKGHKKHKFATIIPQMTIAFVDV